MGGSYQYPSPITLSPFADKSGLNYNPDSLEFDFIDTNELGEGQYVENYAEYLTEFPCKFKAINPILKGHSWGDYSYITIHASNEDRTFLMKLGRFFKFDDSVQNQGWIGPNYDAYLPAGLIIRINYGSRKQGLISVNCIFNLDLHKIVETP